MTSITVTYHSLVTNFLVDEASLYKSRIKRTTVEGRCNNIPCGRTPLSPMSLCF
jgi:hypothetical protein